MKVQQAARLVGISADTIRYWERRGLIRLRRRGSGRYRELDDEALARLRFITRAKRLGFRLREIAELLALLDAAGCAPVRKKAEQKAEELSRRIEELQRMRALLLELAAACQGQQPCPVWQRLSAAESFSMEERDG